MKKIIYIILAIIFVYSIALSKECYQIIKKENGRNYIIDINNTNNIYELNGYSVDDKLLNILKQSQQASNIIVNDYQLNAILGHVNGWIFIADLCFAAIYTCASFDLNMDNNLRSQKLYPIYISAGILVCTGLLFMFHSSSASHNLRKAINEYNNKVSINIYGTYFVIKY